jgi:hypothetical protein
MVELADDELKPPAPKAHTIQNPKSKNLVRLWILLHSFTKTKMLSWQGVQNRGSIFTDIASSPL